MRDLEDRVDAVRETIGVVFPVQGWNAFVTNEAIEHFAHGMGDDNPLWSERIVDGGRSSCAQAPPMFLYSCSSAGRTAESESLSPTALLPGTGALWKGDRWTFLADVTAGRTVRTSVVLVSAETRHSQRRGTVIELREKFSYVDENNRLLAECTKSTMRFERLPKRGRSEGGLPTPPAATYLREDLDAIGRESLAETRRGSIDRDARHVRVGDALGSVVKGPLTVTGIIAWVLGWGSPMVLTDRLAHRYWAQSPESRLVTADGLPDTPEAGHWDGELARLAGMPRGYDFGSQRISWLSQLVTDWCGDSGRLVSLDANLSAPNLIGDLTRITGEVTAVRDGGLVDCFVRADNQRGERTATARATVRLPVGRSAQ